MGNKTMGLDLCFKLPFGQSRSLTHLLFGFTEERKSSILNVVVDVNQMFF